VDDQQHRSESDDIQQGRPAHIAFMAVSAHGHVNPGLGLIAELVRRGHRVTSPTSESFAAQLRHAGAEPVLYTSTLPSEAGANRTWPEDQAAAMSLFLDESVAILPQVDAAYSADRPDLVIHDSAAMHGPILARKWGIPTVSLSATHVPYEGFEEDFGWGGNPDVQAVFARYQHFLEDQNLGLTLESLAAPACCIVAIPRAFQYRGDTISDSCTFVGPMLAERSLQGSWEAPDERPVLLISMGSAYTNQLDLYRKCVAAYGNCGWHVVLAVGNAVDVAELGELPPNVEVHRWVPQTRILAQASAFITHGGMGGTMEGLYHGVPLIAIPQAGDQFANAARIAQLGLGQYLPRDEVAVDGLREALVRVTSDESIRRRLKEMQREIHASGGVRVAGDVVEARLCERAR
jgi:MGT family glycosyltransferase